ncbi:MAG: protoporphyrinogen oxidase [Bacteroidetes bacterium QS_3_64_15]|nr:MAG: protoporphyrinogen oxidase [Bacteroidetes bacterium QS_3_64_15]
MPAVGVIGAGIAGLAAAYQLDQAGASVQVFEASDRVGGAIRSERADRFLVEHGPNSVRAGSAALESIIDDLGLNDERIWANDTADARYVVRDGEPTPLPRSVGSFLTTDLFSTRAKLRCLAEPFVGRRDTFDESVADFTRRRLGREVLDYAIAPFVGGVFAGSSEDLSVEHAFRRLATLEDEYGSLFLGAIRRELASSNAETPDVPSGLFSFRDGLQTLPNAVAEALGDRITRNAPVRALDSDGDTWRVTVQSADKENYTRTFDALVCTVPLHRLTAMDVDTPVDLGPLAEVWYPPLSVLALGYPQEAIDHSESIRNGFGVLVPPIEDEFNVLGTIFSSTLFPGRAPDGHVLLTTFVGGARASDRATTDPDSLQSTVERDLSRLLGVEGAPAFRRHVHWPNAIPQYMVGYGTVKETLDEIEQQHPRLAFAGNYRRGVSVGDALTSGVEAAERLLGRRPRLR